MNKAKKNKIEVFCSISAGEIKKISSWLIPSLEKQKGISNIHLCLINYTGEGKLYDNEKQRGILTISEISSEKSLGFGEAHNFAFEKIMPDNYFLIINPDVYLHEDCIYEMIEKIESDEKIGIVEARQLPFEHPKEYDSLTGETPWASGFGILVRSKVFEKIGGFDDNFWMYCEDVDLSWRVWIEGYKVIYNPKAVAYHFTGAFFENTPHRYNIEQFWSARNFIYISYKYWGKFGEIKAKRLFNGTSYPKYFKDEVLNSYASLKGKLNSNFHLSNKKKYKVLRKKIKITGFNQYHETK